MTLLFSSRALIIKVNRDAAPSLSIPKLFVTEDGYPWHQLYNRLRAIKKRHPRELVIHIGAEMGIPWHTISAAIDTAAFELPADSYDDRAAFLRARPEHWNAPLVGLEPPPSPPALFSEVVFVVPE